MRIMDWSSDVCSSDLDAEYAACPIWPSYAATEAVLMMTQRSPSIGSVFEIRSAARRRTLKVPIRLTSMTFLNESIGKAHFLLTVLTEMGGASCRERVWQSGLFSVFAVALKTKK